jgi:N-terminal acetyltransferase B complex catalytic subunit
MATFRRFRPDDVNKFSKCNLDPLTETYELNFYLQYYSKWPSLFQVCEDMNGNVVGYSVFATYTNVNRVGELALIEVGSNGQSRVVP